MTAPVLPYERTVLTGAMDDPTTADAVCALIAPSDFLDATHRTLFAAVTALVVKRLAVDAKAVASLAHTMGVPVEVTFEIASEATTPALALVAAKHVLAASQLRALASLGLETSNHATATTQDAEGVEAVLTALRAGIEHIENRAPGAGPIHIHKAEPDLLPRILNDHPTPQGVKTGFHDLDRWLGGLRKTEMIVLAARPSVGKSLFASNIAEKVALHEDDEPHSVLIFTMEMASYALYRRTLFGRAGVNARPALSGHASQIDKQRLQEANRDIAQMRLFLHAESAITPQRMHAIARRFQAKHGPSLFVVDYLGLMHGEGRGLYEQVTNLSNAAKGIATDLDAPFLVLAQLNRNAAEDRANGGAIRIPTLADLRDSGAIEQDADVVIFLARDIMQREPHPTDLVLAKHRAGQTGKTQILFDTKGPRFTNIARVEHFDGKSL